MNYWQALVVGLVQGVTEILPISSTAHLVLLPNFLGFQSLGLEFDVMMNFGSWIAIMFFFRKVWQDIFASSLRSIKQKQFSFNSQDQNLRLLFFLLIATLPAIIFGILFKDFIEEHLRSSSVVAIALILGGLVLWLSDRYGKKSGKRVDQMSKRDAFLIGVMQAVAMIPGVSRSGACIIGGRVLGLERKESATFAFLLGAPVILAAMVSVIPDLWGLQLFSGEIMVAFFAASLGTYLTMGFFYEFIKKQSLLFFVLYRIILGLFILWSEFF